MYVIFRYAVYKNQILTSAQYTDTRNEKEVMSTVPAGNIVNTSIMNGFETITRLGGYILLFLFWPDASDIISHSLLFIKICFWDLLKLLQGSQLFHLLICLSQPVFLYPSRLRHREVCVFLLRQEVFSLRS